MPLDLGGSDVRASVDMPRKKTRSTPPEVSFADGPWAAVRDDVDWDSSRQSGALGAGLVLAAVGMMA